MQNGTPRVPGVPHDATPSPTYLGMSSRLEPTTALFIYILYNGNSLTTKIRINQE